MPGAWTDGLILLPDERGMVQLEGGMGLVRAEGTSLAKAAAGAMRESVCDGPDVLAVRWHALQKLNAGETGAWRGLLALALLADTWREECSVETVRCTRGMTAMISSVLDAADREALTMVVLRCGEDRAILGLADRELALVPAADMPRLGDALPERVTWYDRARGVFEDPCQHLNERDRRRLAARLRLISGHQAIAQFADDLDAVETTLDDDWLLRMKAVLSLSRETAFEGALTQRKEAYAAWRGDNPLLAVLGAKESVRQDNDEQVVYLWRGVPYARSSVVTGVEGAGGEREAEALLALRGEIDLMENYSTRYLRECGERIERYLPGRDERFSRRAREEVAAWQSRAREQSRRTLPMLELTWPWDENSPAVRALMEEALGPVLMMSASQPFPDRLTLMQGGAMSDDMLNQACSVTLGGEVLTALLPLSDSMAEHMARFGWTGSGLMPDCVRLTAQEDGSVEASLLMVDKGNVRLKRVYRPEEQVRWSAEEVPGVSMWPSVPVERGRWKAYYVSIRGRVGVRLLCGGEWKDSQPGDAYVRCAVTRTDEYPACMAVYQDGLCLGALMDQREVYHPNRLGAAVAALDLGAAGMSMAIAVDNQVSMVELPCLWRVLLNGARADLAGEALPVWPMGPVVMSAVVMGSGTMAPEPFVDGRIVQLESLADGAVKDGTIYDLLWRTDEQARRARTLMLREGMLLSAFHAVMHGAESIRWRLALPGGMSDEGRQMLLEDMRSSARWMRELTCLPLFGADAEGMEAGLAAGLYLRESGLLRGSFALLDVGATGAEGAVWLRGLDYPAARMTVSGGVNAMTAGLMEHPDYAAADFSGFTDTEKLIGALGRAQTSMKHWEKARMEMDLLLGAQMMETSAWMNQRCAQGQMTYTQALLTLGFAQMMTLTGLLLEKVYRNPVLNDHLPQEMQLCLCGRGTQVMCAMDETMRYQLMRFLRLPMSSTHPVRSIRLTGSGLIRMESVLGLAQMKSIPQVKEAPPAAPVGPTGVLVKYFLMQFRMCFPQAAGILFPGMFGQGGMFSPAAEATIDAVTAQSAGTEEQAFANAVGRVRASFSAIQS